MKKTLVMLVCALSLFSAGCAGGGNSSKGSDVKLTSEQTTLLESLCGDKSDDGELQAKNTFEDRHCHSA